MGAQSFPPAPLGGWSFSTRGPERSRREQKHHEERSKQRDCRATWRCHVLNRELFQDRRCAPQRTGNDGQKRPGMAYEHTQRSQQSCPSFLNLQQICTEKYDGHAGGLAYPWNLAKGEPGNEQRKGGIKAKQRTHQGGIGPVQGHRRKECGSPVECGGGEQCRHKDAINLWYLDGARQRDTSM